VVAQPFCSDRCSRTIISGAPESPTPATGKAAVDQLIPWLFDEDQQLRGVAFSKLIFDTTGRNVLSFAANNAVDQRVANAISDACDETMQRLNAPNSEVQNVDRINEISSHFENTTPEAAQRDSRFAVRFPTHGPGVRSNVQVIRICASPIWRANACSIWTRSFTLPELATAVFGRFISSQKNRPIKCAMTRCISWSDLSTRHAKVEQVLQTAHGNSSDGTWSIFAVNGQAQGRVSGE